MPFFGGGFVLLVFGMSFPTANGGSDYALNLTKLNQTKLNQTKQTQFFHKNTTIMIMCL